MTKKNKDTVKCVCHAPRSLRAISFHSDVKGPLITLSEGGRRVTRDVSSFCHGLTFSGRPVQIEEKVRLRVEHSERRWHGALRVGFTHVLPEHTTLPPLAIPDLTNSPLFAAVVVPEGICRPGSEIQFWLKKNGCLRIWSSDRTHTEQTTLNPTWPVWAMIDVYGQTTSVVMLGSKKRCCIFTRMSCPALTHIKQAEDKERLRRNKEQMNMLEQRNLRSHYLDNTDHETPDCEECVVCYSEVANCRLSCGHKCVCRPCGMRVYTTFGTCPLCRQCLSFFQP
ncbi:E3 ubiquitin-protein ligase NEURL3-like [Pseudorasbora parva]|uniref:E3 ubiquitin-protein ligase NEURL3-like n=1 Tax=Pseudorasbora parva TaxID=51549 RepID=UPI00351E5A81